MAVSQLQRCGAAVGAAGCLQKLADIPTHIWEWRNGCLSIDTHSNSAISSVRICGYMVPVKTGRERKRPGQDREGKKTTRTRTTRDEPSGVTGPDRTASTPTETPASPVRTPTTPVSGDAPTATVAAATAPPAASGSTKTDREELAALYNATGGENWKYSYNWLSDARLSEWSGIATIGFSRVESLSLGENQLSGEIPSHWPVTSSPAATWCSPATRLTG